VRHINLLSAAADTNRMPKHKSNAGQKAAVTCYLPVDMKARAELAAQITGMPMSGLVERAVDEYLAKRAKALDVAAAALHTLRVSF
jgi:hypothetical protein